MSSCSIDRLVMSRELEREPVHTGCGHNDDGAPDQDTCIFIDLLFP